MKKKLFVLLATILLSSILPSSFIANLAGYEGEEIEVGSNGLTSHAPILINGDSEFTLENGVIGGSGAAEDPYIIEGWDINASTANSIFINSTIAYFVVRNVSVHDGGAGVILSNVTNGRIENIVCRQQ